MTKAVIRGSALFLSVFMLSGCTAVKHNTDVSLSSEETESVTVKLAEQNVGDHPYVKALREFVKDVDDKTDGRVKIELCTAATLGKENSVILKVNSGAVDMARVSSVTLSEQSENLKPLVIPYLFDNKAQLWRVLDSDIGTDMLDNMEGCRGIAWLDGGERGFYSANPITSVEDMKGKTFNVANSGAEYAFIYHLGATPVSYDVSDVYRKLEDGILNGADSDLVIYNGFAHDIVAPYYVKTGYCYAPSVVIASKELEAKIGKDDYKVLEECAAKMQNKSVSVWGETERSVEKELRERGVHITELTPEQAQKFKTAASINDFYYKKYSDVIEKINELKK